MPLNTRVNIDRESAFHRLLADRPVAYHPILAKALNSVTAALFLCQLTYWDPRSQDHEGWVYKTRGEIHDETGLTRREQETARKRLVEAGVLEEKLRGVPATMHYRLNLAALEQLLEGFQPGGNEPTSRTESDQPVGRKRTNWTGGNRPTITEITTESTTVLSKQRASTQRIPGNLAEEVSKFRKGSRPLFEEGNTAQPARGTPPTPVPTEPERLVQTTPPAAESDVTETGMARLSQVLATHGIPPKRARGAPSATPDLAQQAAASPRPATLSSVSKADQDTIRTYLTQYAEEFHDQAPKFSSTMTRVLHYFETSGTLLGPFTARMEAARRRTKADQSAGRIRKKGSPFAYFLSLLEEELGLREAPASFTHQAATTPSEPEPARRKSLAGKYARMVHR